MTVDALKPHFYQVQTNQPETGDIYTLTLKSNDENPFSFQPGQFNMLSALGVGECAISLSGHTTDQNQIVHTIRAVGNVTRHLKKLMSGDKIAIRGPFGTPWPIEPLKQKSILLIAGGIGLAPLRPVIYSLLDNVDLYKNITLIYGTRTPNDIIFIDEIAKWRNQINVIVTVDHSTEDWNGPVGVVTQHISNTIIDSENTIVMMCGPEAMMRFCLLALHENQMPEHNIYISMERNMQCAIGQCGHCQWGPFFICKDGPVLHYPIIKPFLYKSEL